MKILIEQMTTEERITYIVDLEITLGNIIVTAQLGLKPDALNYTIEQWQQHKLEHIASIANDVLKAKYQISSLS